MLNDTNESESDLEELGDLFGGDYSDEDPTYTPPKIKQCGDLLGSDNSDEDPDVDYVVTNNVLDIHGMHPRPVNAHSDNAVETVTILLDDVLDAVWKKVRKKNRWSESNPSEWKKNIVKKRRSTGLPYVTNKKLRSEKAPQIVNCGNCKFKCTEKFSIDERNNFCKLYWGMDFKSKKNFILSNITIEPVKTRRVIKSSQKKDRSFTKKCFFKKSNERIQVCQKFFTKTLCISPDVVADAIAKVDSIGYYASEDLRGRHEPANKIKQEVLRHVKEHIESFPVMESHYTRKDTSRKYLDAKLNIRKMYQLYCDECKDNVLIPVSEMKYRSVFCQEYNFSFFKPKKDQCLICTNYAKADSKKKLEMEIEYQDHIKRNKISQRSKQEDKEKANKDPTFCSISFDLQAVLQIPSGQVSQLYYTRKLIVYNLTIYESALPNKAFCMCWNEINGKKGSCEIGTCLYIYLKEFVPSHVTHITLFSDTCGGQNRNQFITSLLLWAVQNIDNLNVIEQKFLESGHSYMEADSMHSSIENASKNMSITSMNDWKNVFKIARRKRVLKEKVTGNKYNIEPYTVQELKYGDMLNLKTLATQVILNRTKDNNNEIVKWMKIKRIKYIKGETDKIFFNYDLSEEFKIMKTFDILQNRNAPVGPKTPVTRLKKKMMTSTDKIAEIESPAVGQIPKNLQKLYKGPLPISALKKNDLQKLCKKNIIPEELHNWVNSLSTGLNVIDRIPDVAIDDDSEEEV